MLINDCSEEQFGHLLATVLSSSQPLKSVRFLKGRDQQLGGIKKALYQPGRHVLIHGLRGVGKSSLAQTSAYELANIPQPVLLGCDPSSTFQSIIRELYHEATKSNGGLLSKLKELSGNVGGSIAGTGMNAGLKIVPNDPVASGVMSVNDAVRLVEQLCSLSRDKLIVVIDEFDQITDKSQQEHFTNFIKQVSDKHLSVSFIFCGIGDSVAAIMSAHGSADRYFHTVELGRLPYEARYDIVHEAASSVGINIDQDSVIRIARISDGFPHYVHFITEKLFWRTFEAKNNGIVDGKIFELAMSDAAEGMDMKLRRPYENATQKYGNDYEHVLWAAADGHELKRRSTDIFSSYLRVTSSIGAKPLERSKFNTRLNSLKQESHSAILTGSRQGWYEFTEKVVRGYVRLKAEQANVVLEVDHPNTAKRWSGLGIG